MTDLARHNIASRYRDKGNDAEADRVLSGEATPYWLLRHEQERLKREGRDGE